jgi:hypothetical protein
MRMEENIQFFARVIGCEVADQQFTIAQNRGKQVVEVMGHPPGQTADGLYFLDLTALFLQLSFFFPYRFLCVAFQPDL